MVFLIANPMMKKGDVARAFGVTPAWLSTLIHSDAFKARMEEMQREYTSVALASMKEKLEVIADLALDEMIEKSETQTDIREIRANAQFALDRLGFAPKTPAGPGGQFVQNNFIGVDADTLAAARARILNRQAIDVEPTESATSEEVRSSGGG